MKSYVSSPMPPVDIPAIDLPTFFFNRALQNQHSDNKEARPLFVDGTSLNGPSLTLRQMQVLCDQLGSGFYHRMCLRPGDVIAVFMPNSIYYSAIVLAALMTGAACTLANPAYTVRELAHQLEDSKAMLVITTAELYDTVSQAFDTPETRNNVLVVDSGEAANDLRSIFDILDKQTYPRFYFKDDAESTSTPAFIPYSSGTTGLPKGVVLSHRNIISNILQTEAIQKLSPAMNTERTSVAVLPMFHSFGLLFLCFLMPISAITTVVIPKFELPLFLRLVQEHRVTEAMLVPPIIVALAKTAITDQYNLTSLKEVIVGAAPLDQDTITAIELKMPHLNILQGYGLSECSPAISLNPIGDRRTASVGRLLPNIDAMVLDETGRVLGPGESGELCFRGPNNMIGYLNNCKETRLTIDSHGFLHTGDIGYITSEQFVYVTDRKKELIKFNGFQVAPAELEGLLLQHPHVRDCAVIGVYDEIRQTEVPRAFLVLKSPDEADAVVKWLNERVAYYKRLRGGYAIVDAIPKSTSGKILRRMLK
ncbi:hypothetical protein LPJ66_003241 [Kickxella alabastrina]|uniref:Uncharacterized protein n=1 Tax=Kickxella alabastrina TaxID=61397 RepID=A0ACC1IND4_9FUNG|nr:hypothetical protein LPJ66_003241 [Kickxella alabastrina]